MNPPAGSHPVHPHRAARWGWSGLILTAIVGLASSGTSGLFITAGLYVLAVALVAVLRGRVGWARLRGRAAGGVALGSALGLMLIGGAMAGPPADPPDAAPAIAQVADATTSPTPPPTSTPPTPAATTAAPEPTTAAHGTSLAAVAGLTVKGRAPRTGYSRDLFGQTWFDADRNGCDTRNDVLRRDLSDRDMKNSCKVLAGTLATDPYTGTTIRFEIGGASEVDVDHVVALSDAWQKGAAKWAAEKRLAFANDPLNLLAVDAGANRSKGDGDTATWLPPNKPYRCTYVARQVAVKTKYRVWVTSAERDAMVRVLSACDDTPEVAPGPAPTEAALPRSRARKPAAAKPQSSKPQSSKPQSSKPQGLTGPSDVSYANCTAVRAAGAAPIRVGQPGYTRKLDRDGDGVGCE